LAASSAFLAAPLADGDPINQLRRLGRRQNLLVSI
jgi:hypothetical protein